MDIQINQNILFNEQFPRSNKYNPTWVFKNQMGPNPLWLTEFLTQSFDLKPGMRVLDLGCGKGMTSVFLAREFGVQVYAVDLWDSPDMKWENAKAYGVEYLIIPIQADARKLPFARGFFDAVISVDSYFYYGADEFYLDYILQYLHPKGSIGFISPCVMKEFGNSVPEHLNKGFWESECWAYHTLKWWTNLWERSGQVSIDVADNLQNGCDMWLRWDEARASIDESGWDYSVDIEALKKDGDEYIGFMRLVATKK